MFAFLALKKKTKKPSCSKNTGPFFCEANVWGIGGRFFGSPFLRWIYLSSCYTCVFVYGSVFWGWGEEQWLPCEQNKTKLRRLRNLPHVSCHKHLPKPWLKLPVREKWLNFPSNLGWDLSLKWCDNPPPLSLSSLGRWWFSPYHVEHVSLTQVLLPFLSLPPLPTLILPSLPLLTWVLVTLTHGD